MKATHTQCVRCAIQRCSDKNSAKKIPLDCPTKKYKTLIAETTEKYKSKDNFDVLQGWLRLMARVFNPENPREKYAMSRVDEVMEYAKIRGMKRLGIATCNSMMHESRLLTDILEHHGFEVASVSCLCGEVDPKEVGLQGEVFCNPILQAEVLNLEETELNIMVGLCVGHDILFLKHSRAETTPLVVRDYSTVHNPVATLYQSQGRFRDRFFS